MDEVKEQRQFRARKLQGFLEDETVQAAFGRMEARIKDAWAKADDPAQRERLWLQLQLVPAFRRDLRAEIERGLDPT